LKRVFFDTNVLLDILLRRDPFYVAASQIWLKVESGELEGLVSLPSLGTIFYLVRKRSDLNTARQALSTICRVLQVADCPSQAGRMALQSHMPDFEDALQYAIATLGGADCFLTRNPSDFPRHGKVPVLTPEELLKTLAGYE
jgi:predicted nucleic acid-binding protein